MISIVVPVYNTACHLDECISSIVNQSYEDWECILVDDGSTDESGQICDEWVKKDRRLHVIHQTNGGVSRARNRGLGEAKGEFVVFVDSDDWLGKNHLEMLVCAPSADLVVSGIVQISSNGTSTENKPSCSKTFELNSSSIDDYVDLNRKFLLYGPYVKMYKTSIIQSEHVSFPIECSYGEDLLFNLGYLSHVKTISQVNDASYYYRRGTETLSTKKRPNQFFQDYEQWKMLKAFYVQHGLWLISAKELLYERLWGIVYDGIFSTDTETKSVLSIPEIDDLKEFKRVFHCSAWIKWCILHRITFAFR